MKLKDIYIFWDSNALTVSVMPKDWFKGQPERELDGRGFAVPSKDDLDDPAAFLLREFVSITNDVGVKPERVVDAFEQIDEFAELTQAA